jgi:CheY-like chemotaxis protein
VVHQLLTLSRTSQNLRQPIRIAGLVDDTLRLLKEAIDPRMELVAEHRLPEARLLGDSNYLSQVVVNLALNARDAVLEKMQLQDEGAEAEFSPRVVFETTCQEGAEPPLGRGPAQPLGSGPAQPMDGPFVRLTVTDNGTGMEPGVVARALEPFFTTKPVGKGTGLGLTTVFGIVQQHGGWIDIESQPGDGTRVSVFLPAAGQEGPSDAPGRKPPEEPAPGTETVLFVDDEDNLRKLASLVLGRLGYTVILAQDGAEAIRAIEANKGRIDVVILDLLMPRLSGREVLQRIGRLAPEIPVVISSGYSTMGHASELLAAGARHFLAKPYDIDDLARLIRRVLDRGAAATGTEVDLPGPGSP